MGAELSRFDWYEITLDGHDDDREAKRLTIALGARLVVGKGRNGYAKCWNLERDDVLLAQVYSHSARAGEVHITVTSDACDEVVPILRRMWPDHRVSRADVSVDLQVDFDQLDAHALQVAQQRGLSHRFITDSAGGATRYLGAPSSALRVRVYKKSEQLRALHPEKAHEVPDGRVRVELQARPAKRVQKEAVSQMEPADLWGLGKWTRTLAKELLNVDAPEVTMQAKRPTDWVRGVHYLGIQYGPMIQKRSQSHGLGAALEVLEALGMADALAILKSQIEGENQDEQGSSEHLSGCTAGGLHAGDSAISGEGWGARSAAESRTRSEFCLRFQCDHG